MGKGDHATIGQAMHCVERLGKAWVGRIHTEEEQRAAGEWMFRGFDQATVQSWPTGMIEALVEWKLIVNDLEDNHRHVFAGGGIEASDHVRSLLLIERRMHRIADRHHKQVTTGGLTDGSCNECGWEWPCPTYVWATSDTRDPTLDTWDPADDEDEESATR